MDYLRGILPLKWFLCIDIPLDKEFDITVV